MRTIAGRYPWLCRRLVSRGGEYPTREAEIVIEGFPRSGNTFAVIAFQSAQPRLVSVAHHVHAPAPVITAARFGIPAVVLIRQPEEAILSLTLRYPHITIRQALRGYVRFYGVLASRPRTFVVAPFDRVVSDFGAVIRDVNSLYGTSFAEFRHSEDEAVLRSVDQWDRNALREGEEFERGRARPTEARAVLKDTIRADYWKEELAGARGRAERVYAALTTGKGAGTGP